MKHPLNRFVWTTGCAAFVLLFTLSIVNPARAETDTEVDLSRFKSAFELAERIKISESLSAEIKTSVRDEFQYLTGLFKVRLDSMEAASVAVKNKEAEIAALESAVKARNEAHARENHEFDERTQQREADAYNARAQRIRDDWAALQARRRQELPHLRFQKQAAREALEAWLAGPDVSRFIKVAQGFLSGRIQVAKGLSWEELEDLFVINSINALARGLPEWSLEERGRLESALRKLKHNDPPSAVGAKLAWAIIVLRGENEALRREAELGSGPGLPGAGGQTGYNDCAVFALANAAGLPYGVVAERATKLISEGDWRSAAERANPQQEVFKTGRGLNGGEVIFLAEAFGRAEVVNISDFAGTLRDGRPVMVSLVPRSGNFNRAHEVVLSKTFQHNGATWYEMIDSNQRGAWQRLYLSETELKSVIKENGVAFRPEPGTTPALLR